MLLSDQVNRRSDIYVFSSSFAHNVVPKDKWLAFVSTTVETSNPEAELAPGKTQPRASAQHGRAGLVLAVGTRCQSVALPLEDMLGCPLPSLGYVLLEPVQGLGELDFSSDVAVVLAVRRPAPLTAFLGPCCLN